MSSRRHGCPGPHTEAAGKPNLSRARSVARPQCGMTRPQATRQAVRAAADQPGVGRYAALFEPIRIGPKILPNRFYQVPQCTAFGVKKPWSQARHRATKAEGGWGAVCTELAPINPETDSISGACMWDDGDVRALSRLCDEVHAHGALAGIELSHGGVHVAHIDSRWPTVAPSQLSGDSPYGSLNVPKEMDRDDIRRVQRDWSAAASRAQSAGFDIVYVNGAHTFLPAQFLSPFYNQRTDEYGGDLANRARFWLEALEAVRGAVGSSCAIATRISVDDRSAATVEVDEALAFVRLADHLVDLWDVNVAAIAEWGKDAGTSRFYPEGHELVTIGRLREATAKPIVGVSRWTSPDRMLQVVTSGKLDIIGAARPSIADPFLPRKIRDGRLEDIRECIGGNQCIARVASERHIGCSQNATAGEEYRRGWHPERVPPLNDPDQDVLVLGAGPAGMECALMLGRRGIRRVHLVDREPEMGGHLRWFTQLPGLGEWSRLINYRFIQIGKLRNVEFIPNTHLDATQAREYGADTIVVATGARWSPTGVNPSSRGPLPGADARVMAHVLTPEQVMIDAKRPPGSRVVVYDCEGYLVGAGVAEKLALEGYDVIIVTPFRAVSPVSDGTLEGTLLRQHLHELGVSALGARTLSSVNSTTVSVTDEFGEESELACDGVVLVTQRLSVADLYRELRADDTLQDNGVGAVYRVGDCVAPRHQVADVIFDGHRLAREFESDTPEIPLPHLREEVSEITDRRGARAVSETTGEQVAAAASQRVRA